MIYHVTIGERTIVVELGADGVVVDGRARDGKLSRVGDGPIRSLLLDGVSHSVAAASRERGRWELRLGARLLRASVVDERTRAIRAMSGAAAGASGPRPIIAPMPGMVLRVEVAEGDVVRAGQGVAIVEAMKMENELRAEVDARVSRVHVQPGEAVEKDQPLVDFVALDEEGPEGS